MSKILSLIVTPKPKDAELTLNSIKNQTVHSDIFCVIGKPDKNKFSGQIIGETLNDYFKHINLKEYDWIFKSDDDVLYPKDFIESNLNVKYDLIGKDVAMFIKVEPFLKYASGKWREIDMCGFYLFFTFMINGLKVYKDWFKPPLIYEEPHLSFKRSWVDGKLCYSLGFPFLAYTEGILKQCFISSPIYLIQFLGYVYAWIIKEPKDKMFYEFNKYIHSKHKRLYKKHLKKVEK